MAQSSFASCGCHFIGSQLAAPCDAHARLGHRPNYAPPMPATSLAQQVQQRMNVAEHRTAAAEDKERGIDARSEMVSERERELDRRESALADAEHECARVARELRDREEILRARENALLRRESAAAETTKTS